MKFRARRADETDSRIDLTSMIDVVFQLLIFFMVTTTFVTAPGLSVDLPAASSQDMVRESKDLTVTITKEGSLSLGQEQITLEDLERRFTDAATQSKQSVVIIQADKSVEHGLVVQVMDLARKGGIEHLAIATEPGEIEK